MQFNWPKAEEEYGKNNNNFKDYAKDGEYEVKLTDVVVEEKGSKGSLLVSFKIEETDEYKYPDIQHWVSYGNPNWTGWHYRSILQYFGVSEDDAKKVMDLAFKGDDKEKHCKALTVALKKAIAKKKTVPVVVYTEEGSNGKDYARADFQDRGITMYNPKKDTADAAKEILGAEDADEDISAMPF